jgi:hypothetical protein
MTTAQFRQEAKAVIDLYQSLYLAALGTLRWQDFDTHEVGIDYDTMAEIAELTAKAALKRLNSHRACKQCKHFDIDASDDSVGMSGYGAMCCLDESSSPIDVTQDPSPACLCPFFELHKDWL